MKIFKGSRIDSATFLKGVVDSCEELESDKSQVALIGRSNVGKSSIINSLTNQKNLARISSSAGCTQEINLYFINRLFYLVDLPGYGFVKTSLQRQEQLRDLINWYLFTSDYEQKLVILVIDAELGPTKSDLEILRSLEEYKKNIVIVANKIDKVKRSACKKQLEKIQEKVSGHAVIPFSAKNKTGVSALINKIFNTG